MIKVRPLIEVLGKIIKLPKNSYLDTSSLGSGTADGTTVLKGDSTWATPESMGYVPYVGATQDVDLGVYKLTADAVEFSLTPVNAAGAGQVVYDGASGALSYLLNSSNVVSKIGQTMHAYVHNAEAVTITKGQAVYLYQASGNKASVKLAYNTSDATSAKTFGLAAEDIGAGQNGMVICQGVLDGVNTGSYSAGDTLYLGDVPGAYTNVKPYAPNHFVYIGIVERANAGNGQIYVRIQNGYELDEIHDVDLITTPPVSDDVLTYDGSLWVPKTISPVAGGTLVFVAQKSDLPTPSAGVITLADGITYFFTDEVDLTGDRLVCGINTTILGGSSENCRIKSTGLTGTALITSNYSLPMRNITIEADVALNLDGDGVTTALDWFGVNFTNCPTVGTIKDYSNFIMSDCALLSSSNMVFDGTFGTIGFQQCLFSGRAGQTTMSVASTATVTRRFRAIYSSFVAFGGATALNFSTLASVPTEGFILDTINFSGGATYLGGFDDTSLKSLFNNCIGIRNTTNIGHYRMDNNINETVISSPDTWELVIGTSAEGYGNSSKWVHTNQRLTYVGNTTQNFYISGSFTVESALNFQTLAVTIGINGVPQDDEAIEIRAQQADQPYTINGIGVLSVVNGDYIELFVKNINTSQNLVVTNFNVVVQKVIG